MMSFPTHFEITQLFINTLEIVLLNLSIKIQKIQVKRCNAEI